MILWIASGLVALLLGPGTIAQPSRPAPIAATVHRPMPAAASHRRHWHRHRRRHRHHHHRRRVARSGVSASPGGDGRVVRLRYDPAAIVAIDGRPGRVTMLILTEGETIETVAVGDTAAWQVTPSHAKNVLFLMPAASDARSNMAVITDRRSYLFQLGLANGTDPPLYQMRVVAEPDTPAEATMPIAMPPAARTVHE